MLVVDLDGNTREWKTKSKCKTPGLGKSNLHVQARELLHELFPTSVILEEVEIPVWERKALYLDFYLPLYKLAIEVQGQQHDERVSFFQTHGQFQRQRSNDSSKTEWCELNHIRLVHLNWNNLDEWRQQLQST
jgi:hypothetical protein